MLFPDLYYKKSAVQYEQGRHINAVNRLGYFQTSNKEKSAVQYEQGRHINALNWLWYFQTSTIHPAPSRPIVMTTTFSVSARTEKHSSRYECASSRQSRWGELWAVTPRWTLHGECPIWTLDRHAEVNSKQSSRGELSRQSGRDKLWTVTPRWTLNGLAKMNSRQSRQGELSIQSGRRELQTDWAR